MRNRINLGFIIAIIAAAGTVIASLSSEKYRAIFIVVGACMTALSSWWGHESSKIKVDGDDVE